MGRLWEFFLGRQRPYKWGLVYVTLIPVYAVIYRLLGVHCFDFGIMDKDLMSCVYLSISSVTTLGIGDISPLTSFSAIVMGSECFLGVIVAGLFLNSISFLKNEQASKEKHHQEYIEKYDYECKKMLQFCKVINVTATHYENSILSILRDDIDHIEKVNSELKIADMVHMFDSAFRNADIDITYTRVYHFFNLNDTMVVSIKQLIRDINMEYWPEFENLCLRFVDQLSDVRVEEFFSQLEHEIDQLSEWRQYEEYIPFMDFRDMLVNGADFVVRFRAATKYISMMDPNEVIDKMKLDL